MGIKAIKKWSLIPIGDTTKVTFNFEYKMQPPILGSIVDILFIGCIGTGYIIDASKL